MSAATGVIQKIEHPPSKRAVALLLTFTAGFVDAVGYVSLFHSLTAAMTGNTVRLAEGLVRVHGADALKAGVLVAAFLAGSVLGRTVIEIGYRRRLRRIASITFLMEAGLIAGVVLAYPEHGAYTLPFVIMLAGAMGLQTATLTRVGALTVHTTFVTGMLNKFAQLFSHSLFFACDAALGKSCDRAKRRETHRNAIFIFTIWVLYLTGAVAGVAFRSIVGIQSLWGPVGALGIAIVVDQMKPLSVEEERDQAER